MEEETRLHAHFGYIQCHVLLLDEPHVPLITIKTNASYHYSFEHTSQCDTIYSISYYAYFGLVWSNNPLWFLQQFFGHDVNRRPTRSTFRKDTTVEVHENVGDFSDDKDFTPLRLPSTGRLLVKRYLRERCFHLMRNAIPWETRVTFPRIWLCPR